MVVAVLLATGSATSGAQVSHEPDAQIRLAAFTERPAEPGKPILLQVYLINASTAPLAIWNDLDSVNIPEHPLADGQTVHPADLVHVDFGTSGSGTFLGVRPGECVKVTLILRQEQLTLLDRVRYLETTVKLRDGIDEHAAEKTLLLPASVYKTLR